MTSLHNEPEMSNAEAESKKGLTLAQALKDLGWLPIWLMGLGGLSVVDIVERSVVGDLDLIAPFQIVLDGYHRITQFLAAGVEPVLRPMVIWVNAQFNWHLDLRPQWRSTFILFSIVIWGGVRVAWKRGWLAALLRGLLLSAVALFVAAAIGVSDYVVMFFLCSVTLEGVRTLMNGLGLGPFRVYDYQEEARAGLSMLGGIVAALLVLIANAVVNSIP